MIFRVVSVEDYSQEEYAIRFKGDRSSSITLYTDKSEAPPRLGDTFSVTLLQTAPAGVISEQIAAVERCTQPLADMDHAGISEGE